MSGSEKRVTVKPPLRPPLRPPDLDRCPADSWPVRVPAREKIARKVRRKMGSREPEPVKLIKIADMHTMQLVNVIKGMLRWAKSTIYFSSPLQHTTDTALRILAYNDHWKALLDEGEKRRLKMIFWSHSEADGEVETAPWFVAAREELRKAGRW